MLQNLDPDNMHANNCIRIDRQFKLTSIMMFVQSKFPFPELKLRYIFGKLNFQTGSISGFNTKEKSLRVFKLYLK